MYTLESSITNGYDMNSNSQKSKRMYTTHRPHHWIAKKNIQLEWRFIIFISLANSLAIILYMWCERIEDIAMMIVLISGVLWTMNCEIQLPFGRVAIMASLFISMYGECTLCIVYTTRYLCTMCVCACMSLCFVIFVVYAFNAECEDDAVKTVADKTIGHGSFSLLLILLQFFRL